MEPLRRILRFAIAVPYVVVAILLILPVILYDWIFQEETIPILAAFFIAVLSLFLLFGS